MRNNSTEVTMKVRSKPLTVVCHMKKPQIIHKRAVYSIQHTCTLEALVIPSMKAATKYIPPTTSTLVSVGPSLGLKQNEHTIIIKITIIKLVTSVQ